MSGNDSLSLDCASEASSPSVCDTKLSAASLSCLSPLCFPRFGRHPVLILSVLFMLVFGLSVAFSVNVTMFSTLRFFEGFCLAGLALSLYVLSKYPLPTVPPHAAWLFVFSAFYFPLLYFRILAL